MDMGPLSLLIQFFMICPFKTSGEVFSECLCRHPPPLDLTEPLYCIGELCKNWGCRYQCINGYVRKAGTSNLLRCNPTSQQWNIPTLVCIPDPNIKHTSEAPTTHQTTPTPTMSLLVSAQRDSPRSMTPSPPFSQSLQTQETKEAGTTVMLRPASGDITTPPVDTSNAVTSVTMTTVTPTGFASVKTTGLSGNNESISATGKTIATWVSLVAASIIVAAFGGILVWIKKHRSLQSDLAPTMYTAVALETYAVPPNPTPVRSGYLAVASLPVGTVNQQTCGS